MSLLLLFRRGGTPPDPFTRTRNTASWTWVLTDHAGNALAELDTATQRTLVVKRNQAPQASFTLGLHDARATLLTTAVNNGLPLLRCYEGPAGSRILRFHGGLASLDEQATDGAGTLAATFRGPFAILEQRYTAAAVTYTSTDAGQIAKQLIDTTNTDSETGIATTGTIATTKTRDRTYEHKQISEAILELTRVLDGFDLRVEPQEYQAGKIGVLHIDARQGGDQPDVLFEYGEATLANVTSVHRSTRHPITRVRVIGSDGITSEKASTTGEALYGRLMTLVQATDVKEQATADDKATDALRPGPIRVVEFSPDPARAPQPFTDYGLGDTVRLHVRHGSLNFTAAPRVNAITIVIDDDGNDASHTLEIDQADI